MSQQEIEVGTAVATKGDAAHPSKDLPTDVRSGVDVNALMMAALDKGEGAVAALEKLVELEERVARREAERIFGQEFAAFRRALPEIPRDKKGAVRDGRAIMYADLETIQPIVDPILAEHGFFYRFTTEPSKDGHWLVVTCTLQHEAGHSESSTMPVPMTAIPKASKAQEATGTRTYGKRLALSDVLGISTTDDLDGAGPGDDAITEEQLRTLRDLKDKKGVDIDRLLEFAGVSNLAEVSKANYGMLRRFLEAKKDPES